MPPAPPISRETDTRVFWSDEEKAILIACAVDIQTSRPDLAGLPLLRAAMKALPAPRRRRLISLSQAPWFDPGVIAERRRRDMECKLKTDLAAVMRVNAEANTSIAEYQASFIVMHTEWMKRQDEEAAAIRAVLAEILVEIRKLSGSSATRKKPRKSK